MELGLLGVTKAKENQFNNKDIYTVEDLVRVFPRKYLDYRTVKNARDINDGDNCAIVIEIRNVNVSQMKNGRPMVTIDGYDDNGEVIGVVFFNTDYVARKIITRAKYIFCGKLSVSYYMNRRRVQMINPSIWSANVPENKKIHPVYKKISGMSDAYFLTTMGRAIDCVDKEDYLEPELLHKYQLPNTASMLSYIHHPRDEKDIEDAQKRLLFDDLFYFNMNLAMMAEEEKVESPYALLKAKTLTAYVNSLPFKLTEGQMSACKEIINKTRQHKRVNALVQGDVGTGKTEVAKMLMCVAYDTNYQSVIMAPTNILAKQHYEDLKRSFEKFGVKIAFLSSETKGKERKEILKGIKEGSYHMVVGTHAAISKDVEYKDLAIVIVDEEHKFGVKQREKLKRKAQNGVHYISLSATPIPRTLAISLYGDSIDVYTIKTKPNGRKEIITEMSNSLEDTYRKMFKELKNGQQGYIVCPMIEDSESEAMDGVISTSEACNSAKKFFEPYGKKVELITGKMKEDEVADIINRFKNKEFDILVSTTIVEVGVNVPNATIMFIRSAERFGFAQLHQLRGRVGRCELQGYCVLECTSQEEKAINKLKIMCETTDGFKVAEEDLRLRGTGDFIGTSQSGENKYVMLMMANKELNTKIKEEVKNILKDKERHRKYQEIIDSIEKTIKE